MAGMPRRRARLAAAAMLAGAAIGVLPLTAVPVGAFGEPMPSHGGPDQQAQVVAGGRQVVVVGPAQTGCQGSGRLQIHATISQASTGAFGEGTLDQSCPLSDQAWRLTVDAASGAPAFSDGTAQASLVYRSLVQPPQGEQWLGEVTLVGQLPTDNQLATAFRERLGAPWWLVIALAALGGVLLLGTAVLLVQRRRRAGGTA